MTKETSIFLDLVRFSAALTVVFGHIGGDPKIAGSILWQFSSLANVAVIIFFVLSGYVVDYATQRRETDGVSFTSARATRILSVAVPALALTALLDSIGSAVNPVLYAHYHSLSWDRLIASLTFLNEAWGVDLTPGSNLPYWSLGFEVPFYALYGVAIFASGARRIILLVVACLVFGPRIIVYFPMWLLGVAAIRVTGKLPIRKGIGWLLLLSSAFACLLGLTMVFFFGYGTLASGAIPEHSPDQIANDYIIAGLFTAIIIGFSAVSSSFAWLCRFESPIRWLAGATFSLYLFHYPILMFMASVAPWPHDTWIYLVALLSGSIGGSFLLAELTERRKSFWRRLTLVHRLQATQSRVLSK